MLDEKERIWWWARGCTRMGLQSMVVCAGDRFEKTVVGGERWSAGGGKIVVNSGAAGGGVMESTSIAPHRQHPWSWIWCIDDQEHTSLYNCIHFSFLIGSWSKYNYHWTIRRRSTATPTGVCWPAGATPSALIASIVVMAADGVLL